MRGFEQIDGVHCDQRDKAAPVVNEVTFCIMMVLIIMASIWAEVLDVQGAFLNGRFQNGEKVYMKIPEGFEQYYPDEILLLLLKTIYGTVQAAKQF